MQNELRYTVRSREIIDLVSAMRSSRLTLHPYFQRNLVWRDTHKKDFVDTILKGYPFPQIFLARGPINLDTMEASQCVVDGQQRLNTIREFVAGKLSTHEGIRFAELSNTKKEQFLKYEVAVIDFDLDAGDNRLKEVFHRLNRTYYSLSAIEKISSEYSASEFLLVARVLSGEISAKEDRRSEDLFEDLLQDDVPENSFSRDPGIDADDWKWLMDRTDGPFAELISRGVVFRPFEFDRKVPLMFTLNVMCTYLAGYFNRNDRVRRFLEERNSEFQEKDDTIRAINDAAAFVSNLDLPENSMWWSKANFFTLICELTQDPRLCKLGAAKVREKLDVFSQNVPGDYALAAREVVSRKRERELRGTALRELLNNVE
ncbi:MAG: DUF262 domain-containing protein [Hyphomicrobiaceae bacterium]